MSSVNLSGRNFVATTNPFAYKNETYGKLQTVNNLEPRIEFQYKVAENYKDSFSNKPQSVRDLEASIAIAEGGYALSQTAAATYAATGGGAVIGIFGGIFLGVGIGLVVYNFINILNEVRKVEVEKGKLENDISSLLGELADLSRNGLNVGNSDRSGDRGLSLGEHSQTDTIIDNQNGEYDNSDR